MAIAIGNRTASNLNPNGATQTLSHNQNVGANGTLLVVMAMPTVNYSTVTYGGVAMTQLDNNFESGISQRMAGFILVNPPTGVNNIVVTFTSNQWNNTSMFACSFTGANGVGNHLYTGLVTTPNSQSITITENSVIYASGMSGTAQSFGYDIGGTTRVNEFNGHVANNQVEGALSALGLSAGAQNVTTKADSSQVTNYRIEILEAGATPNQSSNPEFFLMF